MVNIHTHAALNLMRGIAIDMGFAPAYTPGVPHGHEVGAEEAEILARLGALEALLAGTYASGPDRVDRSRFRRQHRRRCGAR
jgi:cytosine/adenosine deaminase-related metal-dependent hydrolase